MSLNIPFELYRQIKSFETEKPELSYQFTPNKRFRVSDLVMNINPIFDFAIKYPVFEADIKQPVVLDKPTFIYNKEDNPFIKKVVSLPQKNRIFNVCSYGNQFIPILDEHGIKKRDCRFSKIMETQINGVNVVVKNFAELRNRLLSMFYRKVIHPDADVQYCRDGLSIHGVGSKHNILAIIKLVNILHFRLNLKLRLRDGQTVVLAVA